MVGALSVVLATGVLALAGLAGAQPAEAQAAMCPSSADSSPPGRTNYEPLSATDKELLTKVRWAGLWEMPAGMMAVQKGVNPRVREIGMMISTQHCQLDALNNKAAAAVGFALPNEPNPDQKQWLGELAAANGAQFDQVFVDRLRSAHGKVFSAIAAVRAGTKNSVVRDLAQLANGFVLTHLTLLESTGLVNYTKLPAPSAPPPTQAIATSPVSATTGALRSPLTWLIWVVGAFAVVFGARVVGESMARRREAERRQAERRVETQRPSPRPLARPVAASNTYRDRRIAHPPTPRHASMRSFQSTPLAPSQPDRYSRGLYR